MTDIAGSDAQLSRLCLSCGLCCDGTLFERATATPEEFATLPAAGFTTLMKAEATYFQLPCTKLHCTTCSIYERRPEVCRSFRCSLLRAIERSELTIEEAQAHVARARELREAVRATDPNAITYRARRTLRSGLWGRTTSSTGGGNALPAARLLRLIALDEYLDRWFKRRARVEDPGA